MRRVTGYLEYITREGDTFDALALQMYNEETPVSYTHLTLPTKA